jgi:hypothetical protein
MQETFKPEDFERILAEADELLENIDSEFMEFLEEENRAQLEEHAQNLKKLKAEVQEKLEKEGTLESRSYGEGMHEAIEDIVKAMKMLGNFLGSKKTQAN